MITQEQIHSALEQYLEQDWNWISGAVMKNIIAEIWINGIMNGIALSQGQSIPILRENPLSEFPINLQEDER